MLSVEIEKSFAKCILKSDVPITISELRQRVEQKTGLHRDEYYILHNGRLVHEQDICKNGRAIVVPRLFGGKGGFGSMLRAIGAQIEKTTNREACRDLSGRRLRDINEEKRLKAWIEKQADREDETAERKKKKLEKLCAEPQHEFKDPRYEQQQANLTERIGDAVDEGFKLHQTASTSGIKRKLKEDFKQNKRKIMLDLDIDSDELENMSDDSDNDNSDNDNSDNTRVECNTKCNVVDKEQEDKTQMNDNGFSNDDSKKVNENANKFMNDEASSDASVHTKCAEDCTKQ